MPRDSAPSLGRLRLPGMHGSFEFTHAGHRYRLAATDAGWALHEGDDRAVMATLTPTRSGWVVVPAELDGEWHDALHFLAVAAFLDANDAWEAQQLEP